MRMFSKVLAAFLLSAITQAGAYELPSVSVGGMCPGNVFSLNIDCDPKHPWPRCPPQTYCYATDNVDMGPYYCCPNPPTASKTFNNVPSSIFATESPEEFQKPLSRIEVLPFSSYQTYSQVPQSESTNVLSEDELRRIDSAVSAWLSAQSNGDVIEQ